MKQKSKHVFRVPCHMYVRLHPLFTPLLLQHFEGYVLPAHLLYTVICIIFVVKIFSYAENIRNYFTRNFCYNEYFLDEYLVRARTYAVHAVFVALRILEGCSWTHVYPSVLKADRRSTRSERITLHHHSICRYSIC